MIDCHLHPQNLQASRFTNGLNRSGELPSLRTVRLRAGARLWFANGTSPLDWPGVAELASMDRGVVPGFGLHPWRVPDAPDDWIETLESMLHAYPEAFVGEIGLDRWVQPRDEGQQEDAFRRQIELAVRLQRPVQIHALHADGWLTRVLDSLDALPPAWMLHSWGGSEAILDAWLERGALFSVSGYHLDPRHKRHHDTLHRIPLDRILIETDAPEMPPPWIPRSDPPTPNPPESILRIYSTVARLRRIPLEDLVAAVRSNIQPFLRKGLK